MRILVVLVSAIMALAVAACGNGQSRPDGAAKPSNATVAASEAATRGALIAGALQQAADREEERRAEPAANKGERAAAADRAKRRSEFGGQHADRANPD